MAKKVTRTITVTTYTPVVYNKFKEQLEDCERGKLIGKYSDQEKLIKAINKGNDNPDLQCIAVKDVRHEDVLYGMTQEEFMKHAVMMENYWSEGGNE